MECFVCRTPFHTTDSKQKYCSIQCRQEGVNTRKREAHKAKCEAAPRACKVCNSLFVSIDNRSLYCSHSCKIAIQSQRESARYHADPDHKLHILARNARSREKNGANWKETGKEWREANRERNNAVRMEKYRKDRYERPWLALLGAARSRAVDDKVPFTLTREWGKSTWTGFCALSELPFVLGRTMDEPRLFSPSIDRKIPRLGYTPDNCWIILWAINGMKSDGTLEEVLTIVRAIASNHLRMREAG